LFLCGRHLQQSRRGDPGPGFCPQRALADVVSNNKFTAGLDLVIEILSQGKENRERDLLVKRQLYEKFGIGEYWVVDSENRSVKVYKLDAARLQSIATFRDSDEITTDLLPGFRLTVSALFNL